MRPHRGRGLCQGLRVQCFTEGSQARRCQPAFRTGEPRPRCAHENVKAHHGAHRGSCVHDPVTAVGSLCALGIEEEAAVPLWVFKVTGVPALGARRLSHLGAEPRHPDTRVRRIQLGLLLPLPRCASCRRRGPTPWPRPCRPGHPSPWAPDPQGVLLPLWFFPGIILRQ